MNFGKMAIMGDSYSTFAGWIPEEYACYYGVYPTYNNDLKKVEQTWWWKLVNETESNLVFNNSYSGSTVCNTGRPGQPASATFLRRAPEFFNGKERLDTIFVFGSTNDSWLDCPLGEATLKKWSEYSEEELLCVRPAIGALLDYLRQHNPLTRIITVINTDLKPEIADMWLNASEKSGCIPVVLQNIEKNNGHPTDMGMTQIKDQIIQTIGKK